MSKPAMALVVALAATGANAQDTKSGQSDTPAVARANGTRPFLFDGRMPGDGVRRGAITDDHHSNARHATESKPASARTMSPRTRSLNYSLAPCPLWPLRVPSDDRKDFRFGSRSYGDGGKGLAPLSLCEKPMEVPP
jgi:hypothetical protein